MTKLAVLDTTVQKTHEWLRDIEKELGFDNDRAAYAALRGVLHALRGFLAADQVAHLGAQLPMLIRGLYYEGWDPSAVGREDRNRQGFLGAVARELQGHLELRNTERATRIVLDVMARHLTAGEIEKIVDTMPHDVKDLWPPPPDEDVQ